MSLTLRRTIGTLLALAVPGGLMLACGRPAQSPPVASRTAPVVAPAPFNFGNHHHPIATPNAEAQRLFDEGFDLVFGFNHEEAVRSFKRAAELDPKSPMPHWGIAWALGPNYNLDIDDERSKQAYAAMQNAIALSKDAPEIERAYVEAMALRFSTDPKANRTLLAKQYADRMGALSRRYPDDLDAATLYAESLMNLNAWKLWSLKGAPASRTEEIVAVLESVLSRNPDHVGAIHYYIHTMEASPHPERALAAAQRLPLLAPAAGHLVHMPAHIMARTGDHAGAAAANLAGAEADREYLKTAPADGFYGMAYYPHNLHFLVDSEMMVGRLAAARDAAQQVATLLAPHTQMMPMVESLITIQTAVLLRFGLHDEILRSPAPPADHPVEVAWWHFAKGVALARTGKADAASVERAALADAVTKVPEGALFGGTGLESARVVLALTQRILDARIAWAKGAKADSIRLWTSAVVAADALPYDEPPVFFYPVRESLGAALLEAERAVDAERVFREDLARHPRNARALFGLQASLTKQGKAADAAWVKRQADAAWTQADRPLVVDVP